MPWYMWVLFLGFIIALIITTITVFSITSSSDSKSEMSNGIITVAVINSLLTVFLGGAAFFWTASSEGVSFERPYLFTIVHIALLLSIIGVSISALQKLDMAAVTGVATTASGATGGCPSA